MNLTDARNRLVRTLLTAHRAAFDYADLMRQEAEQRTDDVLTDPAYNAALDLYATTQRALEIAEKHQEASR